MNDAPENIGLRLDAKYPHRTAYVGACGDAGSVFGELIECAPIRRTRVSTLYNVRVRAIDGRVWYGRCALGNYFVARPLKSGCGNQKLEVNRE